MKILLALAFSFRSESLSQAVQDKKKKNLSEIFQFQN